MSATWEIWLDDDRGKRLALVNEASKFYVSKSCNNPGWFNLTLPGDFDDELISIPDGIVEYWRAPTDGALKWVNGGFIRRLRYGEDKENGRDYIEVAGPTFLELLKRRIIAYAAGTSQADKTDYSDDMLKELVDENLESASTDTDRDLTNFNFTVSGQGSDGPSVSKAFSWTRLLYTMQEITEMSREDGTELYFDIVASAASENEISLRFYTFTDYPGIDRTGDSMLVFGKEYGNLSNPLLEYDYVNEVNYIYAGGQEEGSEREVVEVEDATAIGRSVWNRREAFVDCRDLSTTASITDRANAELQKRRAKLRFSADLNETDNMRYGIEWNWGDKVVATYRGKQLEGIIKAVSFSGKNKISARLEVEE
jgi:hypothetical protein